LFTREIQAKLFVSTRPNQCALFQYLLLSLFDPQTWTFHTMFYHFAFRWIKEKIFLFNFLVFYFHFYDFQSFYELIDQRKLEERRVWHTWRKMSFRTLFDKISFEMSLWSLKASLFATCVCNRTRSSELHSISLHSFVHLHMKRHNKWIIEAQRIKRSIINYTKFNNVNVFKLNEKPKIINENENSSNFSPFFLL
jgi:hypothetical protein